MLEKWTWSLRKWTSGVPAPMWLLGLASLLNVGGLSLLWPVNAIYIHTVLGKPLTVAGIVLMVYSGAGFVGSALAGWLFDKWGAMPVLASSLLISAAVILLPDLSSGWGLYIVVMAVFGVFCAMPFPIFSSAAQRVWPQGGRRAFNFIYVSNNIGVALGTAVGGFLAQWSFHAVFIGITGAYLLLFIITFTLMRPMLALNPQHSSEELHGDVQVQVWRSQIPWGLVGILLAGFVLAWVVYVQWQSTISVYMQAIGYPLSSYSVLWTLNGVLIFAAQPIVGRYIRYMPSLANHMILGTAMYAVAFIVLLLGHSYPLFVSAMVVMTCGELLVWPSVPAAIAVVSPENRLGFLQGLTSSAATFGRMLGPLFGGVLYDHVSMRCVLSVLVAATALPILCFVLYTRWQHHTNMSNMTMSG